MTQGALIFAFNNESIDYVAMARWSAARIRRWLGLPVAIVTDCEDPALAQEFEHVILAEPGSGDQRQFDGLDRPVTWYNTGRPEAYDLTPWDHTLLLDADYVVASDQLKLVMSSPQDFVGMRWAVDVSGLISSTDLNSFGRHRLPQWWATVMSFRRGARAQFVFDSMKMVRANWQHYRDLYGITNALYRNDYALSIALTLLSGGADHVAEIPWYTHTVMPGAKVSATDADTFRVCWQDQQGRAAYADVASDLHVMDKSSLGALIATH